MPAKSALIKYIHEYKWLFIVLIFHIILTIHFFPIQEVLNDKPITVGDYAIHYYNVEKTKHMLNNLKLDVYDPFFYAGGSTQLFTDLQSGYAVTALFTFIFPSTVLGFKIFIFIFNFIFPLAIYIASTNFGLEKKKALLAMFISVLIWQFDGIVHFFNYFSIFFFVFSSYISVLAISFLFKYVQNKKIGNLILALLISSLTLLHGLVIIFLIIAFFILSFKIEKNIILPIITIVVLLGIVFFTIFWDRIDQTVKDHNPPPVHQSEGFETIISDFRSQTVHTFIILGGSYGIYLYSKSKERFKFIFFLVITFVTFAFSYFGSYIYLISYIMPKRLLIPLTFFLIIPFTDSITSIMRYIASEIKYKSYLVFFVTIILISLIKYPELIFNIENQLENEWNRQLTTELPEDVKRLIEWINYNTTRDARILIESSGHKTQLKYGGYNIPLIQIYTKREFIGDPYPYINVKSEYIAPSFYEGILFNVKNVSQYSLDELEYYFDQYNIKWIICWSNESKETFDKYPQIISKINQIGQFSVYEISIKPNYFIKGTGMITADFNNITITNSTQGEIVIKYLYSKKLKSDAPIVIRKYPLKKELYHFISILNENTTSFRIYI